MKLLTEREQVRTAASGWRAQYGDETYGNAYHARIGRELASLNVEYATADDVAAIVGNTSWARKHRCDECGAETWDVVQLGEEPGHDSNTVMCCVDCLRAALRMLGNTP